VICVMVVVLRGGICVEGIVIVSGLDVCAFYWRDRTESWRGTRNVIVASCVYGSTCVFCAIGRRRRRCFHVRGGSDGLGGVLSASIVVLKFHLSRVYTVIPYFYSLAFGHPSRAIGSFFYVHCHVRRRHFCRLRISCSAWYAHPLPRSTRASAVRRLSSAS
jgi:hypothetical protein